MISVPKQKSQWKDELGAVLTEHTMMLAILVAVLIASAALLYDYNPDGEHRGAIVERGEAASESLEHMSPVGRNADGSCAGEDPEWCM